MKKYATCSFHCQAPLCSFALSPAADLEIREAIENMRHVVNYSSKDPLRETKIHCEPKYSLVTALLSVVCAARCKVKRYIWHRLYFHPQIWPIVHWAWSMHMLRSLIRQEVIYRR